MIQDPNNQSAAHIRDFPHINELQEKRILIEGGLCLRLYRHRWSVIESTQQAAQKIAQDQGAIDIAWHTEGNPVIQALSIRGLIFKLWRDIPAGWRGYKEESPEYGFLARPKHDNKLVREVDQSMRDLTLPPNLELIRQFGEGARHVQYFQDGKGGTIALWALCDQFDENKVVLVLPFTMSSVVQFNLPQGCRELSEDQLTLMVNEDDNQPKL